MATWLGSYSATGLIGWLATLLDANWLCGPVTAC